MQEHYKDGEEPVPSPKSVKEHAAPNCHENHDGSSKSMEWHGAVTLAEKMVKENVYIAVMCSDDDSTMKDHLFNDPPEPVCIANFNENYQKLLRCRVTLVSWF